MHVTVIGALLVPFAVFLKIPGEWPAASRGAAATPSGGLAQLARAPALQAGGQRFESVILHMGENRIDAVNPISDTLMMDAVNPEPDT